MNKITKRDYYLDVARGIACLFVLMGHITSVPQFIRTWIYSFHMPLFFIISGMVLNVSDDFVTFLKKHVRRLLIPYFVLNLTVWVIESTGRVVVWLIENTYFSSRKIMDGLVGVVFGYRLTKYYYILWFVIVLFVGMLVSYGIVRVIKKKSFLILCGILMIIMNSLLWKAVQGCPFSLDVVLIASGFILIGYSLKKVSIKSFKCKRFFWGVPMLLLNGFIALIGSKYYGNVDLYSCHTGGYCF